MTREQMIAISERSKRICALISASRPDVRVTCDTGQTWMNFYAFTDDCEPLELGLDYKNFIETTRRGTPEEIVPALVARGLFKERMCGRAYELLSAGHRRPFVVNECKRWYTENAAAYGQQHRGSAKLIDRLAEQDARNALWMIESEGWTPPSGGGARA